jgi:hypothetical protein
VQPVLAGLRRHRWSAPRDLRTTARRLDRGLLVLVPDQRPAQRRAPEVPDLLGAVAVDRSDEAAVGEEVVPRLDDAELVPFGIGEHHVRLFLALSDVDVPAAELERPRHCLLLVLEGRAGQIEVGPVLAGLLVLGRGEIDLEPGVVDRQQRDDVVVFIHLPAQDAGPEARESRWVVRIEGNGDEV